MKMKAKIALGVSIVVLIVLAVACFFVFCSNQSKQPFKDVTTSDIENVYVLFGAYEPYALSETEKEEFIALLADIVIYEKDDTYKDYTGVRSKMFYLEQANDKGVYIAASNPFFIIDEIGYRTEYEACDQLSKFYVKFINKIKDGSGIS